MAYPINPVDGQKHGDRIFDESLSAWKKYTIIEKDDFTSNSETGIPTAAFAESIVDGATKIATRLRYRMAESSAGGSGSQLFINQYDSDGMFIKILGVINASFIYACDETVELTIPIGHGIQFGFGAPFSCAPFTPTIIVTLIDEFDTILDEISVDVIGDIQNFGNSDYDEPLSAKTDIFELFTFKFGKLTSETITLEFTP